MLSRFAVTLLMALGLALAPMGASYSLGLGGLFSNAEVQVAIVEQSKDGVVLSVHGTDYKGRSPGIEIALNPAGYVGSGTRNTFIKSVTHNPADPGDWTVEFTLDAAQVAQLDPGTNYQIMTMRGGGRDVIDSHDTDTAGVPLDFDALAQPSSDPTPEQPSEDTGSEGSGGSGGSGGTSSGRSTGGTGGTGEAGGDGDGAGEEPKAKKSKKPWSAPEEPPTVKGLELTGIDDASVDADDVIHAQASGFKPNETGIKVVVYSTPLVLSTDIKANGHGVAKWSGRLPKDIGLGKHTLTFQGSVDRGIRFVVTGTPSDGECVQSGCAPATGAVKKQAAAESGGVGGLTWIIVATMIVLALVASAVALLAGRRRREQDWEWDEPSRAQAPRYPSDPRQASGPYPAASPRQPQAQIQAQHLQAQQRPGQPMQGQPMQGQHLQRQPQPEPPLARRGGHEPRPGRREQPRSDRREPQVQAQPQSQQPPRRRAAAQQEPPVQRRPGRRAAAQPAPQPVAQQAPQQPAHRQPRPPESFAPPSERPQAYAGQRVAGR